MIKLFRLAIFPPSYLHFACGINFCAQSGEIFKVQGQEKADLFELKKPHSLSFTSTSVIFLLMGLPIALTN
jgi:hypothetical protein